MIFDYIIENFGEEKFTDFLNSIKHVPVDKGIEFHLDCDLGHFETLLETKTSVSKVNFEEIYSQFWDFYKPQKE